MIFTQPSAPGFESNTCTQTARRGEAVALGCKPSNYRDLAAVAGLALGALAGLVVEGVGFEPT